MTQASSLTKLLHEDHLRTLAVINDLETRVTGPRSRPINTTDAQDRVRLQEFVGMIEAAILRHYRFEEEVLFPQLAGAGFQPITDMLAYEHDTVRSLAGALRDVAATALAEGFTPATWSEFGDGVADLMHSVSFHIQKEEMGVIRQLDMVLGTDADRQLGARYVDFS